MALGSHPLGVKDESLPHLQVSSMPPDLLTQLRNPNLCAKLFQNT